MPTKNRILQNLRNIGFDEPPPVYIVVAEDRRELIRTPHWPEAKGFRDQWARLGYPRPRVIARR